jgi:Rod binding domain-containing protein
MSDFISNIDNGMTSLNLLNSKLDNLKGAQNLGSTQEYSPEEKKKIEQTSRSFESMFVNMMMKQMKEAQLDEEEGKAEGEMNFGADSLKQYGDMLFGDYISKSGQGIGIGEMIYKTITGESSFPTITNKIKSIQDYTTSPINSATTDNKEVKAVNNFVEKASANNINAKAIERISNYDSIISKASEKFGVSADLIKSIITAESAGRNDARSGAGAKGLMQLMDGTAKDLGVNNVFDPAQNIMGGTKYISSMLDKYDNNLDKALAAYNAGPGNVDKYNGVPPFSETQNYVRRVKSYLNQYSKL